MTIVIGGPIEGGHAVDGTTPTGLADATLYPTGFSQTQVTIREGDRGGPATLSTKNKSIR